MPYNYGQAQDRIQSLQSLREAIAQQQPTTYAAGGLNLLAQILAQRGQAKAREQAQQAQIGMTEAVMSDVQGSPAQYLTAAGPAPEGGVEYMSESQAYSPMAEAMTKEAVAPVPLAQALATQAPKFGMGDVGMAGLQAMLAGQSPKTGTDK